MLTITDGGAIKNPDRCRQLIEFQNMKFDAVSPTDIDALIEYHNEAYIFYEFKLMGATMSKGQSLALERLADDCSSAGKKAVVFLCEHNEQDVRNVVDAGNAFVKAVYFNHRWKNDIPRKTVKDWTTSFINYIEKETR